MASVTYSWNQDFDFSNVVINTTTAGNQSAPAVAALTGGGWVAAWVDPGNENDIRARVLEDDGTPRTATDFAVLSLSNSTAGSQLDPSLATLTDGTVAVARTHTVGGVSQIQLTSIDADGSDGRLGISAGAALEGDVAALPGSEVVLSYTDDLGADGFDVRALPSDPFGSVNVSSTSTTIRSRHSAVASLEDGFVVVYHEATGNLVTGFHDEVFFRRFDSNAVALDAAPVLIDTSLTAASVHSDIQVESLRDGGFVVAYVDNEFTASASNHDIHVKIYNQNGSLRIDLGRINVFTTGVQDKPTLTLLSNGFFVVGWQNQSLLKVQAFDPVGNAVGAQTDQGGMIDAEIAGLADGRLVNVRSSNSSDTFPGSTTSIRASAFDFVRTTAGDAASETLAGDELIDLMTGGEGDDAMSGGGADDTLDGGGGNDTLDGGAGVDALTGGAGNDFFFVDSAADGISEGAGQGTGDRVFASVSYTLGAGDQVEIMSTTNNAGAGVINLSGNEFANTIFGNAGTNRLDGRTGADSLIGFGGNDFFFVDNAADAITERAGEGTGDRVFVSVSYTLGAGDQVEIMSTTNNVGAGAINLTGNELGNTIFGNAGANTLDGRTGADSLIGFGGNDFFVVDNAADAITERAGEGTGDRVFAGVSYTLGAGDQVEIMSTTINGGTGAINLTGNEFANAIFGNAGSNVINGKAGADTLVGFGGADFFLFDTALNAATNVDAISGFSVADDTIRLENAVFTAVGTPGTLAAAAFRTGASAADASDRIVYNSATGAVFYDADGLGGAAAIQFATVGAGLGLTNADFIVV